MFKIIVYLFSMICFTVAVLANEPNLIMGFGVLVIITKLDVLNEDTK
jgi:hypothetical protein